MSSALPSFSAVTVPASARAPTVGTSSVVPLIARKRCTSFPLCAVGVEANLLPWVGFCFLGVSGILWFACGFGGFAGSSASSMMPLLLNQIHGVDCRCSITFTSCGSQKLEVAPLGLATELVSRLWRSFTGSSGSEGGVSSGSRTTMVKGFSAIMLFLRVVSVNLSAWRLCCVGLVVILSFSRGFNVMWG